jgi:hypothetical protein
MGAYQEMLLKMSPSTVEEVVEKFNGDSAWADAEFVAQLVATVGGSRGNNPELIEFMTKMSESRGYSAVVSKVGELEGLLTAPSVEEGFTNAIARSCKASVDNTASFRRFAVADVSEFLGSEAFPVRVALSELRQLVDAIADPVVIRRNEVRSRGGAEAIRAFAALLDAKEHDNRAQLGKAVEEACGMTLSGEAVVAAAEAFVTRSLHEGHEVKLSLAQALKALFEPLRACLEVVKSQVEVVRGYRMLDALCVGASQGTALELFAVHWGVFHGSGAQPEVDPLAAAIVEQDLEKLKQLIGGHEVKRLVVEVDKFPLSLRRCRWKCATLLEVAAGVGGAVLRYLLEFHGLVPEGPEVLAQAVACGDPETIRMIWDRMDEEERVKYGRAVVASVDFHRSEVARWLISEHGEWLGLARRVAREKRAFDVLSRLPGRAASGAGRGAA